MSIRQQKIETEGEPMEKNVNMTITDGEAFFAHELSVNFNPMQFILDFKCVTPRVDPRSKESIVLNMKHNVIMVDPFHAKRIATLLGDMVKRYEKDFGKIERPKALERFEKNAQKAQPASTVESSGKKSGKEAKIKGGKKASAPSYLG
ncbi:MAG TPA: DUF3467 domain-containing protein [Candidatus Nanoarchaeia archaeon]|nr:DUF3467 domain-containing protein [Candidatus Nanoarchaeia archaeon]